MRRSEEPSPTSVVCYWRPPRLNAIRSLGLVLKVSDMKGAGSFQKKFPQPDPQLFELWKRHALSTNLNCQLLPYLKPADPTDNIMMDQLAFSFKSSGGNQFNQFLDYCEKQMSTRVCEEVEKATRNQSDSKLWFKLRFGRVTASKFHEFSKCKTMSGTLVESIMGGICFNPTESMKRGLIIESRVFEMLKNNQFRDIQKVGLLISSEFPFFGASPDAISNDAIFEIKSPTSEKTKKNYIKNNNLNEKVLAQMQLQMLFAAKNKGFLVISDPNFEENKKFEVFEVLFDRDYCNNIISECLAFYEKTIFKRLMA